jgi:hypothetical protein
MDRWSVVDNTGKARAKPAPKGWDQYYVNKTAGNKKHLS